MFVRVLPFCMDWSDEFILACNTQQILINIQFIMQIGTNEGNFCCSSVYNLLFFARKQTKRRS